MATIDQIKQDIADVRASIGVLERDIKEIVDQQLNTNIAITAATNAGDAAEVSRLKAVARDLRSELNNINDQIEQLNTKLGPLGRQLQQAEQAAAAEQAPAVEKAPIDTSVASAGELVQNSQAAKSTPSASGVGDDNPENSAPKPGPEVITPTGRITPAQANTSGTNATPTASQENGNEDINVDGPGKTIVQTQATSEGAPSTGPLKSPPVTIANVPANNQNANNQNENTSGQYGQDSQANPLAATNPGVGDNNDNASYKNPTRTEIDNNFSNTGIIAPKSNILDSLASYTYNAAVYMMDAASYTALINTGKRNLSNMALLFQSGGAPAAGRNPYFSLDYYIDNIEITGQASGKGTKSAHNSLDLKFTVIEPNGITLIENLNKAVTQYIFKNDLTKKKTLWAAQNFLMVITFTGYDSQGNIVGNITDPVTGKNTFAEKLIGFTITELNFKVSGKTVEYNFEATTPGIQMNSGTGRGVIPYNVQLSAASLKEALGGQATVVPSTSSAAGSTNSSTAESTVTNNAAPAGTPAPPTAAAAPTNSKVVTKGLMEALNQYQRDEVTAGRQKLADIYEIEFASPALASAKINFSGGIDKQTVPMNMSNKPSDKLDASRQSVATNYNTLSAVSGTSILQFLEKLARNSTYIQDQQTVVIDPDTQKQKPNGAPAENISWFRFGLQATPIAWDDQRNDYAYRMKFVVTPYYIANLDSGYFPGGKFRGVHKKYSYWFTGENTSVLSYEQTYNTQYFRIMTGSPSVDNRSSNLEEAVKRINRPRSDASAQGGQLRVNEPAANAADYLYNPSDLADSVMTIVGDPAWLFQGEVASLGASGASWTPKPFLSDGTINPESGQIYYEINFRKPQDYDLNTGLMDPYKLTTDAAQPPQVLQSYVYLGQDIVSYFKQGKFTQELSGTLYTFKTTASGTSVADLGRDPNQSAAETARLARLGNANGAAVAASSSAVPSASSGATNTSATPEIPAVTVQPPVDKNPG